MKPLILGICLALCASPLIAQATRHTAVTAPENLKWQANPAFPQGVLVTTLVGNPATAGDTVVMRIKFPPHFTMPPHTHPYSEVVTVVSGHVGTNGGTKAEKVGGLLPPGSLWLYPARHPHYAWTGDYEAVLQVQFTGPAGIEYVNPADDPRRKK